MCLNIHNPQDISVLRSHEICHLSYLSTRRFIQVAKLMYNLAQNNKFKKSTGRETRENDSYHFVSDIIKLKPIFHQKTGLLWV